MPAKKTVSDYQDMATQRGLLFIGDAPENIEGKALWRCAAGHEFERKYRYISRGYGCPYCAGKMPKTEADYLVAAERIEITFLGPVPKNAVTKTLWRCKDDHEFWATYDSVSRGHSCPHHQVNAPKTDSDYHALARTCGLSFVGVAPRYTNQKATWQCADGHRFDSRYNNIQQGQGCPICASSNKEVEISLILCRLGIPYEQEKRFEGCVNKRTLAFDFFLPSLGVLLEYHGKQHYTPIDWFGGEKAFRERQRLDAIKVEWAKANGYIVIVIPYTVTNIEEHLKECLAA